MSYFKTNEFVDGKRIAYTEDTIFLIQLGKNKSSYKTRYTIKGNLSQAILYYEGLNVHGGYKKRLYCDTMNRPVLARMITY